MRLVLIFVYGFGLQLAIAGMREVMVPMRDGVRLQTLILTPNQRNGENTPCAIILERTPYGVPAPSELLTRSPGGLGQWVFDNYCVVYQSIRGRFRSEGTFVMMRPPHAAKDTKGVDETTDAWDTVDWLVRNLPSNRHVALTGGSYDAWTAMMGSLNPHPAVRAVIEEASPADMFLGDDFHHNGAMRLSYAFEYSGFVESDRRANWLFDFGSADLYDWFLARGAKLSAPWPTWNDIIRHPAYDTFWVDRALPRLLTAVKVPVLNVAGWWDAEDFYGPQAIYFALERHDTGHENYFVAGPWNHGSFRGQARRLGPLDFGSDTGKYYRDHIYRPWLDHWLRSEGTFRLAEATVFETGTNQWRHYDSWPPPQSAISAQRLYMHSGGRLSFDEPNPGEGFDKYVSNPLQPVPYRKRPVDRTFWSAGWRNWLLEDQRFVRDRSDVLSWRTEPLANDLTIAGSIGANLFASTSGTDSDWVVKLIDQDPSGYELIIASEIFRASFRRDFSHPVPLTPNEVFEYPIDLHTGAHAFLKGHRVMVQVQSTWFPLYNLNSGAGSASATQRVYHRKSAASTVTLPVVQVSWL